VTFVFLLRISKPESDQKEGIFRVIILQGSNFLDISIRICVVLIKMKFIKFVVTAEKGTQSTSKPSMNSKEVKLYPQNTILKVIQIQTISSEQRIRGQIQDSLDWVSIKDTSDEFMWMKPIPEVTKTWGRSKNHVTGRELTTNLAS
jgi:hypothetical protein